MKQIISCLIQSSCLLFSSSLTSMSALAQVTSDGTTSTKVTSPDGRNFSINDGDRAGANLFHSFQDFSVPNGGSASFNNAVDIANIFSRVTGGNISNIDGLIRANGSANLFLINPAGIMFGQNARLDMGGSFLGSTADRILFENGSEFIATDGQNQPILTINAPIGLGFRNNPAEITVEGMGNGARLVDSEVIDTQEALRVDADSTIGLVGGKLRFEDATIKTAGGRIELGSVAGGQVNLRSVDKGWSFDYSAVENFSDISLSGRSNIDASGLGGGDIQIAGQNITLRDISAFEANTLGGEAGGDIKIFAAESLEISGVENELNFVSGIGSRVFPNGRADGGDITIETGNLRIGDRAFIATSSFGQGNAGDITINASNSITLESQGNSSAIASSIGSGAIGNAGDIKITTPSLTLSNEGALLNASSLGEGNGGNINISSNSLTLNNGADLFAANIGQGNGGNVIINARDFIALQGENADNSTVIFTFISENNTIGDAGNIELNTGSITLNNGADLSAANTGQGNGGNIIINATDDISLNNDSDISTSSTEGRAGNIEFNANSVTLSNDADLLAFNFSLGEGADVIINATEDVSFTNDSDIFVNGTPGGSISITAKNLTLISDSAFSAGISVDSGFANAQSGNIVINLTEDLVLDGLDGESITSIGNSNFGTGNAGNIEISARNITFKNGGNVVSLTNGEGDIGSITLTATGDISLDGIRGVSRSGISNSVSEEATGDVGEINITARNLTLTNGAEIQSQVSGMANSGDINLNVADTIRVDGFRFVETEDVSGVFPSEISSNVSFTGIGNSGNININTQNLFLSRNGFIDTQLLGQGNAGNIRIEAIDSIVVANNSFILSNIGSPQGTPAVGKVGSIFMTARNISLSDTAQIQAGAFSGGTAEQPGVISLTATESISFTGTNTGIFSNNDPGSFGDASDTTVSAPNITLNNGAVITADNRSNGQGGKITLSAKQLTLNNDSVILADVFGAGDAGSININATNSLTLTASSAISAAVDEGATGDAGNINIETQKLTVSDGSQILVSTGGQGNAGNLTIRASELIEVRGTNDTISSGLFASALVEDGNGGDLEIFTKDLIVSDGASISVSNFPSVEGLVEPGTGEAGNLTIEANSLHLENRGRIDAATQAGNGGNITLQIANEIILRDKSLISAQAFENANGGNVTIDAEFIIAPPNQDNDIIASAEQGRGGNINITAEGVFGLEERSSTPPNQTNDIDASSGLGLDGNVVINTPDVNSLRETLEAPEILTLQTLGIKACSGIRATGSSNFTLTGKGGVPPQLTAPLSSSSILIEGKSVSLGKKQLEIVQQEPIKPVITAQGEIYPARGIIFQENGEIILTAHPTDNVQRTPLSSPNCGVS